MCFEVHARQAGFNASKFMAQDLPDPAAALAAIERAGPQPPAKIWFEQPVYYKGNRFAIAGTGADVIWPAYSKVMDYELEFAAIIGTKGVDIPVEKADAHIFGYTIYNDFSARDAQFREMSGRLGPAKGKDFDGGTILGPCIVTADEIADPYNLAMTAKVNGEIWTDGRSNTIQWTFAQMIAHVSQSETIYPGEVFGSGTVGNGCGLEAMRFLQDGDVVELDVEKIGTVRNRVLAPHLRLGN
jgi:2-keto-4-pentenoate hydratase/2-oxohepta-3-ene-1,7-dioic acid hydratase in catechol pathway